MAPIAEAVSIHRRSMKNLGYFFNQDKPILIAVIILVIVLAGLLFIALFSHAVYRWIHNNHRQIRMGFRMRRVNRQDAKAQKEALALMTTESEQHQEPNLDQLQRPAAAYSPAPPYFPPEYLAASDPSQLARSVRRQYPASVRSLSVSDHSSIPLSSRRSVLSRYDSHADSRSFRSHADSRSFRSPTPLSISVHGARPGSARPGSARPGSARSARPGSVASYRTVSVVSHRRMVPAPMAPEPSLCQCQCQHELWNKRSDVNIFEEEDAEAEAKPKAEANAQAMVDAEVKATADAVADADADANANADAAVKVDAEAQAEPERESDEGSIVSHSPLEFSQRKLAYLPQNF